MLLDVSVIALHEDCWHTKSICSIGSLSIFRLHCVYWTGFRGSAQFILPNHCCAGSVGNGLPVCLSEQARVHGALWPPDAWRWPNKGCLQHVYREETGALSWHSPVSDILWFLSKDLCPSSHIHSVSGQNLGYGNVAVKFTRVFLKRLMYNAT